jgi:hypothetical protein
VNIIISNTYKKNCDSQLRRVMVILGEKQHIKQWMFIVFALFCIKMLQKHGASII